MASHRQSERTLHGGCSLWRWRYVFTMSYKLGRIGKATIHVYLYTYIHMYVLTESCGQFIGTPHVGVALKPL